MMARSALLLVMAGMCIDPRPSLAAQLHVEPVLLELTAPAAAGVLNLRNDDDVEAVVQTRGWFAGRSQMAAMCSNPQPML